MTGRARSASACSPCHMRRLGRKDMLELTRILTMNVRRPGERLFRERCAEGPALLRKRRSACSSARARPAPSSICSTAWPRSASTASAGLHLPTGGMGSVTAALAAACRSFKVRAPRQCARAARAHARRSRAGRRARRAARKSRASIVLSSADPAAQPAASWWDRSNLDTNFAQRMRHLRMNGCSAKIHLALDSLPECLAPRSGAPDRSRRARLCGARL